MVVGGRGDRDPKQPCVQVYGADDSRTEDQELRVLMRSVPWNQEAAELVVAEREVHMLPGTVHAFEWLLVEQALHAVLLGNGLEGCHEELLMVGRDVAPFEHRRDLELPWRHLVVPGLGRDPEFEQFTFGVHHESEDPLGDGTEVVVVELLALGRLGAEQCAAGVDQVGTRQKEVSIHQEVLLLGPAEGHDVARVRVTEQPEHTLGVLAHRLLGAQKRGLVIEGLAGHRHENCWYAESIAVRVLQHICRTGHIPAGVPACLEGVAKSAVGEARRIGLTLDECLALELCECRTVARRLEEAVVLLRGQASQGIEDVSVMGRALLQCPILHR